MKKCIRDQRVMGPVDLKIVLLGNEAVGKSCLMQRYIHGRFSESLVHQSTIGSAFSSKIVNIDNKKQLLLGLWDTAGSERYYSMTKSYYRGAAAAIVCYDVTKPETIERAKFWIAELRSVEENCKIYLCGTKVDLLNGPRTDNYTLEKIKRFADGVQIKFFLTSSKTGENVEEMFGELIQDFLLKPIHQTPVESFILLGPESKKSSSSKSWWCCNII